MGLRWAAALRLFAAESRMARPEGVPLGKIMLLTLIRPG